jgi:2'-5' RNA ligase
MGRHFVTAQGPCPYGRFTSESTYPPDKASPIVSATGPLVLPVDEIPSGRSRVQQQAAADSIAIMSAAFAIDAGPQPRCAVWALPHPRQYRLWQALSLQWAVRLDGLAVPPHITITSGLASVDHRGRRALARLAATTTAWRQPLLAARAGGNAFEALVVDTARTLPLLQLRRKIRHAAGLPPEPFVPHASLAYGRVGDPAFAAAVTTLADQQWPCWLITNLECWLIQGPPDSWRRLKRIQLRDGGHRYGQSSRSRGWLDQLVGPQYL